MPLKMKLVGAGIAGFLTWLLWPKKAQAKSVVVLDVPKSAEVVVDERPAAQAEPKPAAKGAAKRPGGKKPAAKPGAETLSDDAAQAALDQVWPLIEGSRADRDTLTAALRWAQQVGDAGRADDIMKKLGG